MLNLTELKFRVMGIAKEFSYTQLLEWIETAKAKRVKEAQLKKLIKPIGSDININDLPFYAV